MNITGGKYKGTKIIAPDERITRPTLSKVRMGVFNSLYSLLGEFDNLTFLDLFGGSGIIGLEALSRGFSDVTVVEQNKKSAFVIKKNYEILKLKPNLIIGNAVNVIQKIQDKYTVVYIDPPYKQNLYKEVLPKSKEISQVVVLEHLTKTDFDDTDIINQKKYGDKLITYVKGELYQA